jgi:RHS repeat-associated protein
VGRITQARITSRNETFVATFERDEFGRVTEEIQQGKRIKYERDVQGRVTKRTLPNGAKTTYEFATDGALDRLDHDGYRLELQRDKLGREVQRVGSGGAHIVSAYDELDRLTARAAGPLGEKKATARRFYTYDKAGRVKEVQDDRWGHAMYFYDPAGRLLESRQFRLMETFLHDPASSIVEYVTQANDGDVAAISVFTRPSQRVKGEYGKGGRLLKKREWSYEYDKRGRRVAKVRTIAGVEERTEYDWDGRDKLRVIRKPDGTRLEYSYDVFGRRVSKTRSGGALDDKRVEYVWNGEVLAWEMDTETGPRAFVHEPGGFEPILQQQGGETYLCVNDHLGMPKELIDGEGRLAWAAAHGAYGAVIATQGPDEVEVEGGFVQSDGPRVESPFRLLGQVNDPDADLCWTRFRCFDAETGTWISTDPLEISGGLNLYGLDGSPSDVVDPLGLSTGGGGPHATFPATADEFTKQLGVPPSKEGMTKDGTKRTVWEPNSNTRIRHESHPEGLKAGDPGYNPRHHGEHYHVETKPNDLSWGQAQRQGKITKAKPAGYTPGSGTGFLEGEPLP